MVTDNAVKLHVLPLEQIIVSLQLVKLVLQTGLLLDGLLVVTVQLLVVLHQQAMLVAVVALHVFDLLVVLLLPTRDKTSDFGLIFSAEDVCGFGRQAGERGSWRDDKAGLVAVLIGGLVADLLNFG